MPSKALQAVMYQNRVVTYAYSRYLNHMPRALTPDMVESLARDCDVSPDEAFLCLFSAACGLETDTNPSHRSLERNYLRTGVRRLDPEVFRADAYFRTVVFSNQKIGKWEMRESDYAPFEPFVCNHPVLTKDFREIPQIGYFSERFTFPAILENGVEWMTVTPNEIETMRAPIAAAHGRVLTLGLGLGYFAFCAAEKETVERVTVVERDADVIDLFTRYILPQFPHKEKIEIVKADAFDHLETLTPDDFDYLFADLWHDQSDGLPLYLRLRRMEQEKGWKQTDYWIEPTLLSSLRHMVYDKITDTDEPMQLQGIPIEEFLSDAFLKKLAPDVKAL